MRKFSSIVLVASAALALGACTTRPVEVNTPGPGTTTIQVPVPATPDNSLTTNVRTSINNAVGTDAAGVEVKVQQGNVFLTGRVATEEIKQKVIAAAQGTANIKSVTATGLVVN